MIYLIDASVLITASHGYFEIDRVPEFWDWLFFQGQLGRVKIPHEIYEEFRASVKQDGTRDALAEWANQPEIKKALLLQGEANITHVQHVLEHGYKIALPTDVDLEAMAQDPFLISYAFNLGAANSCIVSAEGSKKSQKFARSKVPDVCENLGVKCCNLPGLLKSLNFSTDFRRRLPPPPPQAVVRINGV